MGEIPAVQFIGLLASGTCAVQGFLEGLAACATLSEVQGTALYRQHLQKAVQLLFAGSAGGFTTLQKFPGCLLASAISVWRRHLLPVSISKPSHIDCMEVVRRPDEICCNLKTSRLRSQFQACVCAQDFLDSAFYVLL